MPQLKHPGRSSAPLTRLLTAPNHNNTRHFHAIGFVPRNPRTPGYRQLGSFHRIPPPRVSTQFDRPRRLKQSNPGHSANRPRSVTFKLLKFLLPLLLMTGAASALAADTVERWGMYEIAL